MGYMPPMPPPGSQPWPDEADAFFRPADAGNDIDDMAAVPVGRIVFMAIAVGIFIILKALA
jgi:hypothetical protein